MKTIKNKTKKKEKIDKNIFIEKKIDDIEIKMLRENEKCYIKIIPIAQKSIKKQIYIMLNNEKHQWYIYDEEGNYSHKIYLKGKKIEPCFYLLDDKNKYHIKCKYDKIILVKMINNHNINNFLKKNCNCISTDISCWAISLYNTSRIEKKPFSIM